jgi:hypothetical protein
MPKLTEYIYAAIGLWLALTLSIQTTGYGEAVQSFRGLFWGLLSIMFGAILTLLSVIAFS